MTSTINQQLASCKISQDSLKLNLSKNAQSLNLKLAQRRTKKELIDQGILPSSKIPALHYDQMKKLQNAKLRKTLKTKIAQRPNRESLVEKNILSDAKESERQLMKAKLAISLCDKLQKRPGLMELVKSGILLADTRN